MAWMAGAFIFCPCHLPITLSVIALLLGGTAAGALLRAHPYYAGAIVTAFWIAGTWRGFALVNRARKIAATWSAAPLAPAAAPASASRHDRP